jgi:hypothetical protein
MIVILINVFCVPGIELVALHQDSSSLYVTVSLEGTFHCQCFQTRKQTW